MEYVLTDSRAEQVRILFFNDGGNVIGGGTIDELSPYPDDFSQIKLSNLMIGNQNGSVSAIQVQVYDADGNELRNYIAK